MGHDLCIHELAEAVKAVVSYQGGIEFDSSKPDGTPRKLMDVGRLNVLGWRASMLLDKGLSLAYQDFLLDNSHKDICAISR